MYKANFSGAGVAILKAGKDQFNLPAGESELSDADAAKFADDLIKLQQSDLLVLKQVEEKKDEAPNGDENLSDTGLTPEQKAERKDEIRKQMQALEEEKESANTERKNEIRAEAKKLQAEFKNL